MPETPYAETEALLAVLNDDEDEALSIVDDMLPGERRLFVEQLNRLAALADDRQRCPRCKTFVSPTAASGYVGVGHLGSSTQSWHRECLDAQRAEGST